MQQNATKTSTSSHTLKQMVGTKPKFKSNSEEDLKSARNARAKSKKGKESEEEARKTRTVSKAPIKSSSTSKNKNLVRSKNPTTTHFFPSEKMYSNALKSLGEEGKVRTALNSSKNSTIINKSRKPLTIHNAKSSPKTNLKETSVTRNLAPERPRTATLRKGSIVNSNIVGPEVEVTKSKLVKPPSPKEFNYEDDFDSYESDFEKDSSSCSSNLNNASDLSQSTGSSSRSNSPKDLKLKNQQLHYTSLDDEKKLDSGNYDLPSEYKHKHILDDIRESIERDNANLGQMQNNSNPTSLSDEGFEEAKSLQFINFLGAQKKYKHKKTVEKQNKRGEEIFSMIKLDSCNFTLLDLPPIPYDVYIKNFGNTNTLQVSVQTGEDKISEESQTEGIVTSQKWTQIPVTFPKMEESDPDFWEIYKCSYKGSGGDNKDKRELNKDTIKLNNKNYNENTLQNFLLSAGNLILNLKNESNSTNNEVFTEKDINIPFSKGFTLLPTATQTTLKNRAINAVTCSSNKILTIHGANSESNDSIICIWNICNIKEPELFLTTFGELNCCIYETSLSNLVFGGTQEGTLAVWDTTESCKHHKNVNNRILRTPTFITELQNGHESKIISLHPIVNSTETANPFDNKHPKEICSVDEEGEIIVWGVIFKSRSNGKNLEKNHSIAHWGAAMLVKNMHISLKKTYQNLVHLLCKDSAINPLDPNRIYVATNYGFIIHCLINSTKTHFNKFISNEPQVQVNCLQTCPFSPFHIIAGFDNGDVAFYCNSLERPLMIMSSKKNESRKQIEIVQWSHTKPFILYTKDSSNTIQVWDLRKSDLFPIHLVPFEDTIKFMKLSSGNIDSSGDDNEEIYMVIATDGGLIYLHTLSNDHNKQSYKDYLKETKTFLHYINRYM